MDLRSAGKSFLRHDFLPPLYNTQFQNTSGGLLFMNQLETVLYRTYVYRLYPTAEQQTMLADRFDFEDENYNAMARRINELYGQHAHKADAETAIRQYSISCPGIDYQGSLDHTRKELFQAVQKLWQGSYNKIYSRPVTRNHRCFYFKTMAVSEFHIIVPTIGTILRDTHRPLPVGAKALSGQIFYSSYEGRYYAHILIVYTAKLPAPITPVLYDRAIGLDYAQDGLYRDSNGHSAEYPGFAAKSKPKREALQQALSRAHTGSRRWRALRAKLAKLDRHTQNQRRDWQYKQSKRLLQNHDLIATENLDFVGMKRQNPRLTPKIEDNQYPAFLQKLQSKAIMQGKRVVRVDRYYPSSQICSACGAHLGKLPLAFSVFRCPQCGTQMQRDLNAAKNILHEGLRQAK